MRYDQPQRKETTYLVFATKIGRFFVEAVFSSKRVLIGGFKSCGDQEQTLA
jgi:hypothetical protein